MREIEFGAGCRISEAVEDLHWYKDRGESVYGMFNGYKLCSDTVTMDSAHLEILGKTREQWIKEQEENRLRREEEKRKHTENIPELTLYWRKEGRKYLSVDTWEYWDKIVPVRLGDLYEGIELGYCLKIVDILNRENGFELAKQELMSQGHSGMSFGLMCSMIKEFHIRGEEFVKYVRK